MTMRVSDYIMRHLEQTGAGNVFLMSGGMIMHLLDALGRTEGLSYRCFHHEQAAAIAADASARRTGRTAVCLATAGPGATNLLTGIVGAWQDSSPVLFLTGQCKLPHTIHASGIPNLRQFGMCEVDIVPIVRSVTKYAVMLDDPARVRHHLEKALHLAASGRPGPVLLDIPLDIQAAQVDPERLEGFSEPEDAPRIPAAEVGRILERLRGAERPLILAGLGIRAGGAVDAFSEFARRMNVPVAVTQIAKDILEHDHPLFAGHPGVRGNRPGNFAVSNADVILCLGCSLHVLTTGFELDQFAPGASKILIDPDPAILRRENVGAAEKHLCDVRCFLEEALNLPEAGAAPERQAPWRDRVRAWKERYSSRNEPHRTGGGPVNVYTFVDLLGELLDGRETVVTDTGTPFFAFGQALRIRNGLRYVVSGAFGAMGYALPAALGVAAAVPDAPVVCVTGDGSLQTNIQELQTLRHYGMDVKLFVLLNDGYLSIRNTQNNFFRGFYVGSSRDSGVSTPPLDKIAAAYGIPYVECPGEGALRETVRGVLAARGPVICGIVCQPDQQIMPAVTSALRSDGTMESRPLHDMWPFLDAEELRANMCGGGGEGAHP